MRGRKPEPEGKRVTICVKVSEPLAAAIDSARGDASRSAWVRDAISGRLTGIGRFADVLAGLPPQADEGDLTGLADEIRETRESLARPAKKCKHPKVRGKGVCPDCHEWVASKT